MPAPHDGPPPPKRRRPVPSSSAFPHPSYNRNTPSDNSVPPDPGRDSSPRFHTQGSSSGHGYQPAAPQDSHHSPAQKSHFTRPMHSSQHAANSSWLSSHQPTSGMVPTSASNRALSATNGLTGPPITPLPPMSIPNISLPITPMPTVPFTPPPPEFSARMIGANPMHRIGQATPSQPALDSEENQRPPNAINPQHLLESASTRAPNPSAYLDSAQRRISRIQPRQPAQVPRTNANGAMSQSNARCFAPTLRDIEPVVSALALIPDGWLILSALAQVLTSQTNATAPNSNHREQILNFKGFPHNFLPSLHSLLVLSKVDLDILAWIFVVSKHGRKDEVARRVLNSLRAPLMHRVPNPDRRPNALSFTSEPTVARAASEGGSYRASNGRLGHGSRQRTNMPNLGVSSNQARLRGQPLLNHLGQQVAITGAGLRRKHALEAALASRNRTGPYQSDTRRKMADAQANGILKGYDFMHGENPFNRPMRPPLGISQNYVVFTSVQLSRVGSDPVLIFPTPAPIRPEDRPEAGGGDLQIHLRCLRLEPKKPKNEWKQSWPFPAACRVNGHNVTLNQAQRYTNGKLAGLDTATNISPFLRKYKPSSSENNRVTLRRQTSTATPSSGQFVMFAQEILVRSREAMSKEIRDFSERYWADHRRILQEKGTITPGTSNFEMARIGVVQFLTDPDGLTVSSMKVSLKCPLALTRIVTPVKGKRCHHVQCFDLDNFLEYTRRSSKFECPVCNKNTAFPDMLVISPYIENALENFTDCDEVEISQDGTMVAVERKQTGVASDDEDEDIEKTRSSGNSTVHNANPTEVVDLTLDSDEDDDPISVQPQSMEISVDGGESALHRTTSTRRLENVGNHEEFATGLQRQADIAANENGEEANGNTDPLDQDIDFTFRSTEFNPWAETTQIINEPVLPPARIQTAPGGNSRENWPIDVIAIDSD